MTDTSKEIQVTISITYSELNYLHHRVIRARLLDSMKVDQFSIIDSICADIVEAALKRDQRVCKVGPAVDRQCGGLPPIATDPVLHPELDVVLLPGHQIDL